MANDELIRKQDALDALMAERKHLLDKGRWGAEHILTHHGYNVIDELPPVQSDVPDIYAGDMISRQVAIDAVIDRMSIEKYGRDAKPEEIKWTLEKLPSAQPEIIRCHECKHNPLKEWFGCPMAHLNSKQRPEDAWCWRGER